MPLFDEVQFLTISYAAAKPTGLSLVEFAAASDTPAPGVPGGDVGEIHILTEGLVTRLLVSLGKKDKISLETIRKAGGALARWLVKNHLRQVAIDLDQFAGLGLETSRQALVEGLCLGAFRFDRYKREDTQPVKPAVTLFPATGELQDSLEKTRLVCGAVNLARDWGHEPANIINPITLAERASQLAAQAGLKCTVLDENELEKLGAQAMLNVGKGSQTPARLIVLEYPGQASDGEAPVVLVGKALTFDTGGYSIKDTTGIQGMKYDKCGGMAVLATLAAASALKLRQPLVGVIGAAENMISAQAYRPDDIISTMDGKTVEIITTDAEGRLVLADALTYSQRSFKPRALIDLATLTGGVVVALGRFRGGLMSNNEDLASALSASGEAVYERLWRLPLDDEYFQNIKGDDADLKNSGGREGHAIYGGLFLKQFVAPEVPWAHLDIAGVADTPKELAYCPKGATGFGVRLLVDYLSRL